MCRQARLLTDTVGSKILLCGLSVQPMYMYLVCWHGDLIPIYFKLCKARVSMMVDHVEHAASSCMPMQGGQMDTHDHLCIRSQSGYALVITTSTLLCIAHSHLPHNVLHSPSIGKDSCGKARLCYVGPL